MSQEVIGDKKEWLDFLNNYKNGFVNKVNASAFKSGTIIIFLISTLILFINKLPSSLPNLKDVAITIIFFTFIFNLVLFFSNLMNFIFRRSAVNQNMNRPLNELEKQYMLPTTINSTLCSLVLFCTNAFSIIYCLISGILNNPIILLSFIVFFLLMFLLTISSWQVILRNYFKRDLNLLKNKFLLCLNPIINLGQFIIVLAAVSLIKDSIVYNNKELILFAVYLSGIMFSITYILKYYSYKIIISWVEQFINEVMINNLDALQIKEKFCKEYSKCINLETFYFDSNKITNPKKWLSR
jgi:hypothetical protein